LLRAKNSRENIGEPVYSLWIMPAIEDELLSSPYGVQQYMVLLGFPTVQASMVAEPGFPFNRVK
jgi:hypothetical protein